ncbi:MAG: hypothetical protein KN64_07135 [Sulfurovum sp. AS07-7]|nr:MAG: hypothetical protein KN64_07135 [Sulfurovum sp. AS07-7]
MNIDFIELKINEILQELENEAMSCVMNDKFDKKITNLHMKPIVSAKQILLNALDSIKMAEKIAKEELEK